MKVIDIIDKLYNTTNASREEILFLLDNLSSEDKKYLIKKSHEIAIKNYGNNVYIRGLIEFTNYCVRDCKYCGIRKSNLKVDRYRLTKEDILECVKLGDKLGYKTYVLQGGEDPYFTDDIMVDIIKNIKEKYPNNAITLSLGERSYKSYEKMFKAGADRYLLRHETANKHLYESLHPKGSFENRMQCLKNLKHKDTPLGNKQGGTLKKTITMLALVRLMFPKILLPSTTALGSIDPLGREKGLKAGGNVVMPNLSPINVRDKYSLYDGKICTGDEAAECRICIERRINAAGFNLEITRGDSLV